MILAKKNLGWLSGAGAVVTLVLAHFGVIDGYVQSVIMFAGINVILGTSLNLVNGFMGEFSCGHAAFMAVGAYTASLLNVFAFGPDGGSGIFSKGLAFVVFPVTLTIAFAAAALSSLFVAFPSFKTRGDYLAIITIAFNYIIKSALENVDAVGGSRGYSGMKGILLAMQETADLPWLLIWIFVAVAGTLFVLSRLVTSTYGRGIVAIREDEVAAELMGVGTDRMKIVVFMVSSGFAGLAGGLYAHVLGYVNPGSFGILRSTECLVIVYLGGMGSLPGSVLAAILFTLLLEALRPLQILKWVVIPLLLILVMHFCPEGLWGLRKRFGKAKA